MNMVFFGIDMAASTEKEISLLLLIMMEEENGGYLGIQ